MLLKISWRNIWRNKRRSLIILTSIVVGVVALILTDTLSMGFAHQMLRNQIGSHVGHIQIHRQGYQDNPELKKTIDRPEEIEAVLKQIPAVKAYSPRVISFGLLSSSYNSSGISIVGINPEKEKQVTTIHQFIKQGSYLAGGERAILISTRLSEKLEVTLGDKVVAMASQVDGSVGSEVFRVTGLFETFDSEFDKTHVYVPIAMAQRMLGLQNRITEFVLLAPDLKQVDMLRDTLRERIPRSYEVLSYKDILPLLVLQLQLYDELIYIYYLFIGIALVFGIINTVLMAVFERIREFGVLMAMGMPNRKLFSMVVLEALSLGILGTVVGLILGYLAYLPLAHNGLNLSSFAEGLASFGAGAIVYPVFTLRILFDVLITVPIFAVIGALYPAYKAIRFEPVEAIRYV